MELEFSQQFSKIIWIANVMKIRLVGTELFQAAWLVMTQLIVTFRNFANVPKIDKNIIVNTILFAHVFFRNLALPVFRYFCYH
jgi:hypothetical protein